MKRTDITTLFPDATEEQIKKLMDLNGSDVNAAKKTGEDAKAQFAAELSKFSDYEDLKAKAAKLDQLEEASKSELQKATERAAALEVELNLLKKDNQLRELRAKVSKEKGIPVELLTGETEDACKAQADGILAFSKNQQGYPALQDGGEAQRTGMEGVNADWAVLSSQLNK